MRVSLAPLPTVSPLVPLLPLSVPHQISPNQVATLTYFEDCLNCYSEFLYIYLYIIIQLLMSIFCPFNFQVATPPRVALPAPALQIPLQAQATFVQALSTASAPNCQVKGFVRAAASLLVAFPFLLWLAHLHPPPSHHRPSAHPLPFLVGILLPFPRQHKPSQSRSIPHPQLCATLHGPKVLSHHAHPS